MKQLQYKEILWKLNYKDNHSSNDDIFGTLEIKFAFNTRIQLL